MEGKQKFDYESVTQTDEKKGSDLQEVIAKVLQVTIGIIMAVLHM